jgi:hypothetical protein
VRQLEISHAFDRWCRMTEQSLRLAEREAAHSRDGSLRAAERLRRSSILVQQLCRCMERRRDNGVVRALARWHRFTSLARVTALEKEHRRALQGLKQQQLRSFMSKFVLHLSLSVQHRSLSQAFSIWRLSCRALRRADVVLRGFCARWTQRALCAAVAQWEEVSGLQV